MTQNSLSTLISTVGYEYSQQKNNVFHTRVTWKGWYPVVESQLDYGDNPVILKSEDNVTNPSSPKPALRFTNIISIPLQFSSGSFTEFLYPSFTSEYSNKYIFIKGNGTYDFGQTILKGRLYFSNYYSMALRDIYPRWAQTFDLSYIYAPFDKAIYGTDISVKTSFYFPGIFPNNGIKLRFEMEKQEPSKYLYGNSISFPRGYDNITSMKLGFFSADYVIPLVYPDFNISSILYVKRIRTDLFYDYASGTENYFFNTALPGSGSNYTYNENNEKFLSYGLELMADFYVLRIPFMISGGLQAAWRDLSEKPYVKILFNVDLFGMSLGKRHLVSNSD